MRWGREEGEGMVDGDISREEDFLGRMGHGIQREGEKRGESTSQFIVVRLNASLV